MRFDETVVSGDLRRSIRRWKLVAGAVGLFLSVLAAIAVDVIADRRDEVFVTQSIERRIAALSSRLSEIEATVGAFSAHVRSLGTFDRLVAREFAMAIPLPAFVSALQFVEYVPQANRKAFENRLRESGMHGFSINDRDQAGNLEPATERPFYFVLSFFWPATGNEADGGLDLWADPISREAIEFAATNDQIVASTGLSRAASQPNGFLFFAPVFRQGSESGLDNMTGLAAVNVDLGQLIAGMRPERTRITSIADITTNPVSLFSRNVDLDSPASLKTRSLDVANRTWRVQLATAAGATGYWPAVIVFLIGILMTLLFLSALERFDLRLATKTLGMQFDEAREKLGVSEASYRSIFGNAAVGACQVDAATNRFIAVNDRLCDMLGYNRDELLSMTLPEVIHPDESQAVLENLQSDINGGKPLNFVVERRFRQKDGSDFWGLVSVSKLQLDNSETGIATSVIQDITTVKKAEHALRMLVRELAHRVRNTTQIIASLAYQTRLQAPTIDDFYEQFRGRLRALSAAQDILFDSDWTRAKARDVIIRALGPFAEIDGERLKIEIDEIEVSAQEAQTLSLAMHELAANSSRHGAWSRPGGTVNLSLLVTADSSKLEGSRRIDLKWTETGGPAVMPPKKRGFGTVMLERLLPAQHNGVSQLSFEPGGIKFVASLELQGVDDEAAESVQYLMLHGTSDEIEELRDSSQTDQENNQGERYVRRNS